MLKKKSRPAFDLNSPSNRWEERFFDIAWALQRKMEASNGISEDVILKSPSVVSAIERHALANNSSVKHSSHIAAQLLRGMTAKVSPPIVKSIGYFGRKFWRQMYEGIFIEHEEVELIKSILKTKQPLVLLPTHRSHMDYVILSFVCMAHNIQVPLVIAGDNLRMPIVGSVLKNSGAVFIR